MKTKKLEKLEAIRGFAALYVVLFHLLPQKIFFLGINVGFIFRFGSEAVITFFVLSGFVIKYTWEQTKNKSFRSYFFRRFIRIYVPFVLILLMAYLLKSYSEGAFVDPEWKVLFGNIFMLQDIISLKPNVISPVYMGNGVLWSLSYEWWFYMLFFVLAKYINNSKVNTWVNIITFTAAVSYLIYPFFVNRIIMYFAIWWIGVRLADIYLNKEAFTFKSLRIYSYILMAIIGLLGLNFYLNFHFTKIYDYPLVAYPFIELRHFVFAFMLMVIAVIWHRLNWIGFNSIFKIFKYLAPFSYVIYISHHYLVVEATYLSFINHKIIEYSLYMLFMFLFSYLIEVVVYTRFKKQVMGYLINTNKNTL